MYVGGCFHESNHSQLFLKENETLIFNVIVFIKS